MLSYKLIIEFRLQLTGREPMGMAAWVLLAIKACRRQAYIYGVKYLRTCWLVPC